MPSSAVPAGSPSPLRPREPLRPEPRALRLWFRYDEQGTRLIRRNELAMLAPPPDDFDTGREGGVAGWWVELVDEQGGVLHRKLVADPLRREYPAEGGWAHAERASAATFWVLLPDLPESRQVVVHGSVERGAEARHLVTCELFLRVDRGPE